MVDGMICTIDEYIPKKDPYSDQEILYTFIFFHILFLELYGVLYFSM